MISTLTLIAYGLLLRLKAGVNAEVVISFYHVLGGLAPMVVISLEFLSSFLIVCFIFSLLLLLSWPYFMTMNLKLEPMQQEH